MPQISSHIPLALKFSHAIYLSSDLRHDTDIEEIPCPGRWHLSASASAFYTCTPQQIIVRGSDDLSEHFSG